MKINKVLAFDIGGTKIAYATVDRNGKILNEVIRHPTPAAPGAAGVWPAQVAEATRISHRLSEPTIRHYPVALPRRRGCPTKVF